MYKSKSLESVLQELKAFLKRISSKTSASKNSRSTNCKGHGNRTYSQIRKTRIGVKILQCCVYCGETVYKKQKNPQ